MTNDDVLSCLTQIYDTDTSNIYTGKGPFTLSVSVNAAMPLAIVLIKLLRFLKNQMIAPIMSSNPN